MIAQIRESRLSQIQVLRGIAILSVLLFHLEPDVFFSGYLGVDLFLFISGYVLAPKIYDLCIPRNFSSVFTLGYTFLKRRLFRLFPSFFFFVLFSLFLAIFFVPIGRDLNISLIQLLSAILLHANFRAEELSQDYFSHHPNLFLHLWSLSYEEQIYILLVVIILSSTSLGIFRKTISQNLRFALILITLSIFSIYSLSNTTSYYDFGFRLYLVALGLVFGAHFQFTANKFMPLQTSNTIKNLFPLVLLTLGLLFLGQFIPYIVVMPLCILFSLFSLALVDFPGKSLLVYLGDRSYVLYLFHFPIFVVFKHYLKIELAPLPSQLMSVVALILSIFFSEIAYQLIDKNAINRNVSGYDFNSQKTQKVSVYSKGLLFLFLLVGSLLALNYSKFFGFNYHAARPVFATELDYGCDLTLSIEKPCAIGNSDRVIALVGDSHATALSPVLIRFAEQNNLQIEIWALKGCKYLDPNIMQQLSPTLSIEKDDCYQRNLRVKKEILSNRYLRIFFSWRSQVCGENLFYGVCGRNFNNLVIKSLETYQDEVVVVSPVPEVINVEVFPPRSLFSEFSPPDKVFSLNEVVDQVKMDTDDLIKVFDMNLINSIKVFCGFKLCYRYNENLGWLWFDSNHISVNGAMMYSDALYKYLIRVPLTN